jgi:hypothetical protein
MLMKKMTRSLENTPLGFEPAQGLELNVALMAL